MKHGTAPKEQIIQLAVSSETEANYPKLFALTSKGSIWATVIDNVGAQDWERIRRPWCARRTKTPTHQFQRGHANNSLKLKSSKGGEPSEWPAGDWPRNYPNRRPEAEEEAEDQEARDRRS